MEYWGLLGFIGVINQADDEFKYVSFDINEVLGMMKENHNLTLTPIVILRDWDEGSI